MKRAILLMSAAFALLAHGKTTTVNGNDVETECTIIVDIGRYDENGGMAFGGRIGTGDEARTVGGFNYVIRKFDDVEDAMDFWESSAETLWSAYSGNNVVDISEFSPQVANLGAVAYALSFNNASIQKAFNDKVVKMVDAAKGAGKDQIEEITEKIDSVKKNGEDCSKELQKLSTSIGQRQRELDAAIQTTSAGVLAAQGQLAAIQRAIDGTTPVTPDQLKELQAQFNAKLTETEQKALAAGLTKKAYDEVVGLISIISPSGSAMPSQVATYSNQVARLNRYLGYDGDTDGDSGEKVDNNDGTFKEPEKRGGGAASDVNDYLSSWGVLGFKRAGDEESPYTGFSEVDSGNGKTNVAASFSAPVNWADGSTVKVNGSGQFYAEVPPPEVTTPWHWDGTNGFLRPFVYAGNSIVTATGADVSAAGNYYVHVSMTSAQGGGFNISAVVNTSGTTTDDTWTFWVGTLASVPEDDGQGGITTKVVCTAELGVMPVILCYE